MYCKTYDIKFCFSSFLNIICLCFSKLGLSLCASLVSSILRNLPFFLHYSVVPGDVSSFQFIILLPHYFVFLHFGRSYYLAIRLQTYSEETATAVVFDANVGFMINTEHLRSLNFSIGSYLFIGEIQILQTTL